MKTLVEIFLTVASLVAVVTLGVSIVDLVRLCKDKKHRIEQAAAPECTETVQLPTAPPVGQALPADEAPAGSPQSPWGLMTLFFASALTAVNAKAGKKKQAGQKKPRVKQRSPWHMQKRKKR